MKRLIFTPLFLILIYSFTCQAAQWRINNTPGIDADFTSFKEAHDAAAAGDTLMFEGSNALYGDQDTSSVKLSLIPFP